MRLEQALGHRVFVRRARHVELTDAGQVLLEETRLITLKLDTLPQRMNDASGGGRGALCIWVSVPGRFPSLAAKGTDALGRHKPQLLPHFSLAARIGVIETSRFPPVAD